MQRPEAGEGVTCLRNENKASDSGELKPAVEEGYAMKSGGRAQAMSHRTWSCHTGPGRHCNILCVPGKSRKGFKQESELITIYIF